MEPPMAQEGPQNRTDSGLVVLVTAGDTETADRIAATLVEEKLAACVTIVKNVRSVYRWKGAVEVDDEQLLIIKTWSDRFDVLEARVLELHGYDVPEIVALPIDGGHAPYLEWVFAETR